MKKVFLLSTLLFVCNAVHSVPQVVDGIYVVVNDAVITFQEVEEAIRPLEETLYRQYGNQPQVFSEKLKQTRAEKIDELIDRQLVLNDFKKGGYVLPESIIDDLIRERIKEGFGSRAGLMSTLQKRGMSFETFRKEVRDDYIVRALSSQKMSSEKILISPQKIEDYYKANSEKYKLADRIKLRMIVLNKTSPTDGAARKLADEILGKIKGGASFAEMASVYSDSQRGTGGDRGWIDRTYFRSELSDVAFSLKAGQSSDVIELDDACYILLVEEVQSAHVKPLDDVRAEIEVALKAEEKARMQKQWFERLRSKAFIRAF